jgi:hypothetical protein
MAARYFRPSSLTWWSGVSAVAVGAASLAMPDSFAVTEVGRLIAMLAGGGDASPAALIFLGTGLIGIRDKMERAYAGRD